MLFIMSTVDCGEFHQTPRSEKMDMNCCEFFQQTLSNINGEFLQHTLSNVDGRLW